jgi:hypothetical protein
LYLQWLLLLLLLGAQQRAKPARLLGGLLRLLMLRLLMLRLLWLLPRLLLRRRQLVGRLMIRLAICQQRQVAVTTTEQGFCQRLLRASRS